MLTKLIQDEKGHLKTRTEGYTEYRPRNQEESMRVESTPSF